MNKEGNATIRTTKRWADLLNSWVLGGINATEC